MGNKIMEVITVERKPHRKNHSQGFINLNFNECEFEFYQNVHLTEEEATELIYKLVKEVNVAKLKTFVRKDILYLLQGKKQLDGIDIKEVAGSTELIMLPEGTIDNISELKMGSVPLIEVKLIEVKG